MQRWTILLSPQYGDTTSCIRQATFFHFKGKRRLMFLRLFCTLQTLNYLFVVKTIKTVLTLSEK